MSIVKLTERYQAMRKQESDFQDSEAAVINFLSASQLHLSDPRISQMILLVESLTSLRKLSHIQLRELLLEIRSQHQSSNLQLKVPEQSEKSVPSPSLPLPSQESPILSRVERAQDKSKPSLVTTPPLHRKIEDPEKRVPSASMLDLDETPEMEDLELEDLKREVAFLTTPSPLPAAIMSDSEPNSRMDSEPDFPFDLKDLDTTPPPSLLPSSTPSTINQISSVSPSESSVHDFTSAFPDSAGEAGTAIFDLESFQSQDPGQASVTEYSFSNSQEIIALPKVSIRTPHKSFEGQAVTLSEKELLISANESLLAGEEVKLAFDLTKTGEHVECKALVRKKKEDDLISATLCLRFLNLRPSQSESIRKELT